MIDVSSTLDLGCLPRLLHHSHPILSICLDSKLEGFWTTVSCTHILVPRYLDFLSIHDLFVDTACPRKRGYLDEQRAFSNLIAWAYPSPKSKCRVSLDSGLLRVRLLVRRILGTEPSIWTEKLSIRIHDIVSMYAPLIAPDQGTFWDVISLVDIVLHYTMWNT